MLRLLTVLDGMLCCRRHASHESCEMLAATGATS